MKTTLLILLLAGLSFSSRAEVPKTHRPAALTGERIEHFLQNPGPRVLEKFDKDKDGKLSDAEKASARDVIKARASAIKDKVREKFDINGDGKLDETERAKARETVKARAGAAAGGLRERLLKRFDADGDGKLNEAERAKAREALEKALGKTK